MNRDPSTPIVSYMADPGQAVLRYKGQHVILEDVGKGVVEPWLVEETKAVIEWLEQFEGTLLPERGVDVCIRRATSDDEKMFFLFDVLVESAIKKEVAQSAKEVEFALAKAFDTPTSTGVMRSVKVRRYVMHMASTDRLSRGFYGFSRPEVHR